MSGVGSRRANRRAVIRASATAILLASLLQGAVARAAVARRPIVLPEGPMLFTRRLRRELAGGHALVSERGFELRFEALEDGFAVRGGQVSSTINAPPGLEAFARLERERVETGMFPLELDMDGIIRSGPGAVSGATLEQAVEMALEEIQAKVRDESRQREILSFILALERAAGQISSAMPLNLFVPPQVPERAEREMALPGGESGLVSSEFYGHISPATGLMSEAARIVVTEAGSASRKTVERWSLTPVG